MVTDAEEGLYLVDVDTLADGEPRNNFLRRAVTWNEDGVLTGARHITLAGHYAYIAAAAGLVVVDLDDPLHPRHRRHPAADRRPRLGAAVPLSLGDRRRGAEAVRRHPTRPTRVPVPAATVPLADAQRIYLARTYAYVAAKQQGLAIVNITNPERRGAPALRHLRRADERRRGRGRRLDQRLALRLCRRRPQRA